MIRYMVSLCVVTGYRALGILRHAKAARVGAAGTVVALPLLVFGYIMARCRASVSRRLR